MKLDRIHQVKASSSRSNKSSTQSREYSANAQRMDITSQLTDRTVATHLVRYVRLVNKTDQEQAVPSTSLLSNYQKKSNQQH